jgi:hypothetical protein
MSPQHGNAKRLFPLEMEARHHNTMVPTFDTPTKPEINLFRLALCANPLKRFQHTKLGAFVIPSVVHFSIPPGKNL